MAALHAGQVVALLLAASAGALTDEVAHKAPAFRLGDAAAPTAYEVRFAIDPAQPRFEGEARIAFRVKDPVPVLWLNATNLAIDKAEVKQGDRVVAVDVLEGGDDFIGLRSRGEPFAAGDSVAHFRYRGPLDGLSVRGLFRQQEAGEWYVLSQFEALSARRAMPCFDEPGWKTPWKLTIDAPAANVVVSNTPETGVADVPGRPGWRRHEFAQTKPLPSYLVALAVGPFEVVDGGVAGMNRTPLRYLAPKGRDGEARYAREATPRLLEILEDYFGTPYPFEKLDSVVIPQAVGFGAMENVGLITYDTQFLLATPARETPRFKRTYASLAAHEIAHMWFGNLVTLAWWDDIWLNEAFATWAGEKARYRFNPEWDTGDYRARSRAEAIALDRLAAARRVRNPVHVREDLSGAFSSITYEKGAAVLEMFEAWLGPEKFRQGVRDYLKQYAFGSATSADFFRAVGEASGRGDEVLAAFAGFVDQPGVPLIDASLRCEGGRGVLDVAQQRLRPKGSKADSAGAWTTPACFRYGAARATLSPTPSQGRGGTLCDEVRGPPRSISLPSCPDWILGNLGGTGHYVVRYDEGLRKRLVRNAAALAVQEAAALIGDSALLAQSGLVPAEDALEIADAAFRHASPVVRLSAVRLLETLQDAWLGPTALGRKRDIIARRVQPLARQVGWGERDKEGDGVRDLRIVLLPFAARQPGGEALRAQARKLALAWQRDHEAIPASLVPPILDTAARFADRTTYDLLESLALTAKDAVERRQLQSALAKVRDPALRTRSLALALQATAGRDAMSGRDLVLFFRVALEDEANRAAAFEYVRANYDALVAKMPQHTPAYFATNTKAFCSPAEREGFVAFFRERAPKLQGGKRRYDEALETIDLCIAARG